jgi:hypothetical protein
LDEQQLARLARLGEVSIRQQQRSNLAPLAHYHGEALLQTHH